MLLVSDITCLPGSTLHVLALTQLPLLTLLPLLLLGRLAGPQASFVCDQTTGPGVKKDRNSSYLGMPR